MSNFSPNSEVWVIDQTNALLFRQKDQMWNEALRMPFAEFTGSAAALSSFSLPDTRIYLNVSAGTQLADQSADRCWAGVAADPVRLIQTQPDVLHHQIIRALKTSGKKIEVICTDNPRHFSRGTPMKLLDRQELKHLQVFMNTRKSDKASYAAKFQLCCFLWLKPGQHYQWLRSAVVVSMVLSVAFMSYVNQQHLLHQQQSTLQSVQHALDPKRAQTIQPPFGPWAEQIRKFGQDERANISALVVTWNTSGQIHTHAQLKRDRKRVPKACSSLSPSRVECTTSGVRQ